MKFEEEIKTRRSVRNYTGKSLNKDDKAKLLKYINSEQNLIGRFGNRIQILYKETDTAKSEKIGTYGFIKNAPGFLICICKNNKENLLDVGYVFENLVLYLHKSGIGTCWIGGTFNRKKLQIKETIKENNFIPIISPVGYPADNNHMVEKLIRKVAKSNKRKDFDRLFFSNNFDKSISDATTREVLEYVRLAPSASNKQPWRIVVNNDKSTHFFIERAPNYEKSLGYDIQMVDMGIALSHYMLLSNKKHVFIEAPNIALLNENYEYVFSVR